MKAQINFITIWTNDIDEMKVFYNKVLGFRIKNDFGNYIEFAFSCESPNDVDESFNMPICKGVTSVHEPQDMPWNQRTAMFADPDWNIHKLFAEIK